MAYLLTRENPNSRTRYIVIDELAYEMTSDLKSCLKKISSSRLDAINFVKTSPIKVVTILGDNENKVYRRYNAINNRLTDKGYLQDGEAGLRSLDTKLRNHKDFIICFSRKFEGGQLPNSRFFQLIYVLYG